MQAIPTSLPGLTILEPSIFADERGFFSETYRREWHAEAGIPAQEEFIQDNHSRSTRGVVRGMHFHIGPGVAKLVRCSRGRIVDVPVGFAHGFCVLSEIADVLYKQTAYYDPEVERGIAWDDPEIGIEWPLPLDELIVSARDKQAPKLAEVAAELPFVY
jgi:dTDP-4-dehydrorhamnose 3,5-epimerase